MDEYEQVREVVAPRVQSYFERTVGPAASNVAADVGDLIRTTFAPGHLQHRNLVRQMELLREGLATAQSETLHAYTGRGSPVRANQKAIEAADSLSARLRAYSGHPSFGHQIVRTLRDLEHLKRTLSQRGIEQGLSEQ